jgi:ABC-type branched-subunit amino acid transport system ATPase component
VLATGPRVLLLDEPAAASRRTTSARSPRSSTTSPTGNIAVVLVEHGMSLVMGISDQVVVIDAGVPAAAGLPRRPRIRP